MESQKMNTTTATELPNERIDDILKIITMCGIFLSIVGVTVQVYLITLNRQLRKLDEIILCEMTVARTIISICELYVIYYLQSMGRCALSYIVVAVYVHSDVVLLILMFLFTRNLFSKIVNVFSVRSYNLVTLSLYVWLAPAPFSIIGPILWSIKFEYFATYYNVYAHLKFGVLAINMVCFFMILHVTLKRRHDRDRNLTKYLKTTVIVLLLITMMSLQVLVTDLLAYYYENIKSDVLVYSFTAVNSYQVIAIMAYFVLMVRNKMNNPACVNTSVRLSEMTTTVSV